MDFAKINHCFTTAINQLAEQEIDHAITEQPLSERLKSSIPIFQVAFFKGVSSMLGRKLKNPKPDKWYVYGAGHHVGKYGEPAIFGPYKNEAEAKKAATSMAKKIGGRVLPKVETDGQKLIDRMTRLGRKMSEPMEYDAP